MKDKDRNINDPLGQLQASKAVFKVLFKDLFNEIKDFKYQIKMKGKKENLEIEFVTVCFSFTAKTIIDFNKYSFEKSFEELLHRIDNLINKGYAWAIEDVDREYINITIYSPIQFIVHDQKVRILNCLIN